MNRRGDWCTSLSLMMMGAASHGGGSSGCVRHCGSDQEVESGMVGQGQRLTASGTIEDGDWALQSGRRQVPPR
jgi:hypothetical protein